jgi:hypothetical protein
MHRFLLAALVIAATVFTPAIPANSAGHHRAYYHHRHHYNHYNHHIKRSKAARDAFMRSHPCPANGHTRGACPGYVLDHIIALKRGGPDSPSNMQWQTVEAAKAKDKWE